MNGGYDDGYENCPCLWGTEPGSLVREYLAHQSTLSGATALDLGCGEGKNAQALAKAGARVFASDCSTLAIENGRRAWPDAKIQWLCEDALETLRRPVRYDIIVMYGLLHCLRDREAVRKVIRRASEATNPDGIHLVVAFNDGPHDLSAHPGFSPLLLPHEFYVDQYASFDKEHVSDSLLYETHPHNQIPHFHSLTRITARKA